MNKLAYLLVGACEWRRRKESFSLEGVHSPDLPPYSKLG